MSDPTPPTLGIWNPTTRCFEQVADIGGLLERLARQEAGWLVQLRERTEYERQRDEDLRLVVDLWDGEY